MPLLLDKTPWLAWLLCSTLICVHADAETQVRRLMQRDTLTREEALQRIGAQMTAERRLQLVHHVVENNKGLVELKAAVDALCARKFPIGKQPT